MMGYNRGINENLNRSQNFYDNQQRILAESISDFVTEGYVKYNGWLKYFVSVTDKNIQRVTEDLKKIETEFNVKTTIPKIGDTDFTLFDSGE